MRQLPRVEIMARLKMVEILSVRQVITEKLQTLESKKLICRNPREGTRCMKPGDWQKNPKLKPKTKHLSIFLKGKRMEQSWVGISHGLLKE